MKKVYIKRIDNDEIVREIDVTGKSERSIDQMVDVMMINLN
ncbi:hypothetical protein LCGC14_2617100, partial [marine sediment metagenome]